MCAEVSVRLIAPTSCAEQIAADVVASAAIKTKMVRGGCDFILTPCAVKVPAKGIKSQQLSKKQAYLPDWKR